MGRWSLGTFPGLYSLVILELSVAPSKLEPWLAAESKSQTGREAESGVETRRYRNRERNRDHNQIFAFRMPRYMETFDRLVIHFDLISDVDMKE
ncbi:hypothetical protein EVAR_68566_1 [Eumeta japonica]|uniref:Uncharacterized protein n=1 Tax=Eumeta variegata TaxID=151549 RepID=A0A4C1SU48_EUMVA|nr:hypothetical protein EVAR_68566_1 [Eumeta japonica]